MAEKLTVAQADLVAAHHELATHAAVQAHWRWPRADPADLLSWAFEGLIAAAQEWDPGRGLTFVGYARHTIRLRIIDCWRRERGRRGQRVTVPFPVDADGEVIEANLAVDEPGFDRVTDAVAAASVVARMPAMPGGRGRANPESVAALIGAGLSHTEIADALDVDPSRISQVMHDARTAAAGFRMSVQCIGCRRRFFPTKDRQRFCTVDCALKGTRWARRGGVVRSKPANCKRCRKLFQPRARGGRPQVFCTPACHQRWVQAERKAARRRTA